MCYKFIHLRRSCWEQTNGTAAISSTYIFEIKSSIFEKVCNSRISRPHLTNRVHFFNSTFVNDQTMKETRLVLFFFFFFWRKKGCLPLLKNSSKTFCVIWESTSCTPINTFYALHIIKSYIARSGRWNSVSFLHDCSWIRRVFKRMIHKVIVRTCLTISQGREVLSSFLFLHREQ